MLPVDQNEGRRNVRCDSTDLVVTSGTIVSPSPLTKHALRQFLQIQDRPREPLTCAIALTSISNKFNTLCGCGRVALAFSMRFSSAVGTLKARGTVAGSMGPMRAECGSVSRASGGCIGMKTLLHTRGHCQYIQRCLRGRGYAYVASFPAYFNNGPVPPG